MVYRVHNIDGNIIEVKNHSMDKWSLRVNGLEVDKGFAGEERAINTFNNLVEALKESDSFKYEEFIQDRVKTDAMPDSESAERYVLSRVYADGSVDDMNYSDDFDELKELIKT